MDRHDAATGQIGLDRRTPDRLRHGDQSPCRFRRSHGCTGRCWIDGRDKVDPRQAQEAPRLLGDIAERGQATALPDHVEQITVLGRGGIGPMTGSTGASLRPLQPDEHRPPRCVTCIADGPVLTLSSPVGEVMPTHGLGVPREPARKLCCIARHHERPPVALRLCCPAPRQPPPNRASSRHRNITRAATCSVNLPAAPGPDAGPVSRTKSERPGLFCRSPTIQ